MIYLIDDKDKRQKALGWNSDKIQRYKQLLKTYCAYSELKSNREAMFEPGNLLLFHESFFDNPVNKRDDLDLNFRNELTNYVKENNIYLVYFSGSIGAKRILDKVAYCPVSGLYSNLEYYLNFQEGKKDHDLRRLLYGKDYRLEEALLVKREIWNLVYDEDQKAVVITSSALKDRLERLSNLLSRNLQSEFESYDHMKYLINCYIDEEFIYS